MNKMNIYLSATAQNQLTQLKAANATSLNRIDKKTADAKTQKTNVESVRTQFSKLKDDLTKLEAGGATPTSDAVTAFVTDYNSLKTMLTNQTSKGGGLQGNSAVRGARSDMQTPLWDSDVLSALNSVGVTTTRDGLAVSNTTPSGPVSTAAAGKLDAAFEKIKVELSGASASLSSRMDTLGKERERSSKLVDMANARTEKNFLQMYQIMQAMNSVNGASATTSTLLSVG